MVMYDDLVRCEVDLVWLHTANEAQMVECTQSPELGNTVIMAQLTFQLAGFETAVILLICLGQKLHR